MDDPPQLAPGLRVVRRGRDQLQVGLYDGRRAVLPRTEAVAQTLAALLDHRPPDHPAAARVLERLRRGGCLLDAGGPAPRPGGPPGAPSGTVAVWGDLAGADVTALLEAGGLGLARCPDRADAVLVLSTGELSRDRLDPLVRSRTSHLVLRLVDGGALLGPFVVPGVTACLRCIDAHLGIRDPAHVAVTSRYVQATAGPRADGVSDVPDRALVTGAAAWAVRDLAAHLDGRAPATWSRTVFWDREPGVHRSEEWQPHPGCGCTWR